MTRRRKRGYAAITRRALVAQLPPRESPRLRYRTSVGGPRAGSRDASQGDRAPAVAGFARRLRARGRGCSDEGTASASRPRRAVAAAKKRGHYFRKPPCHWVLECLWPTTDAFLTMAVRRNSECLATRRIPCNIRESDRRSTCRDRRASTLSGTHWVPGRRPRRRERARGSAAPVARRRVMSASTAN